MRFRISGLSLDSLRRYVVIVFTASACGVLFAMLWWTINREKSWGYVADVESTDAAP
jgi:hypothetical protein